MHTESECAIDKRRARRAFDRAADSYDGVAVLQREIGQRMAERLDVVRLQPASLLDLGCGTGEHSAQLLKRYRKARLYALDFSMAMLRRARSRGRLLRRPACVCGDIDALPLKAGSIDLAWSNAAIQWSRDLRSVFAECYRVLRPGGLLMFTTFGPATLHELRSAWAEADPGQAHVHDFIDMHDIGDLLLQAGFVDPVLDVERLTLTYGSVAALMSDLKTLGARNAHAGRPRAMTGKARFRRMLEAYEQFRRDGRLPCSYEVVFGHAWMPAEKTSAVEFRVTLA